MFYYPPPSVNHVLTWKKYLKPNNDASGIGWKGKTEVEFLAEKKAEVIPSNKKRRV